MKEGEKPVGSGTVYKVYGLSRGDLTDLEDLDGLDFVGKEKRHRWYLSEVAEAKKRREIRRQQEAEARRQATGWDNGARFLEGFQTELAETRARIRKDQDKRIKKLSDQAVREIEAEKTQEPVAKDDFRGQFKALLEQVS